MKDGKYYDLTEERKRVARKSSAGEEGSGEVRMNDEKDNQYRVQ